VLALGASHGRHYHSFAVNYQASLVREEDRMEGALGGRSRADCRVRRATEHLEIERTTGS
jgi:hypothetical protein